MPRRAALPDDVERRALQWAAIYYGGGAIDYDAVQRFVADAPDFAACVDVQDPARAGADQIGCA